MNSQEIREHIKQSKQAVHACVGSGCLDEAATYISLLAYVRYETAKKKQEAYEIQVGAIQAGDTIGKAQALMKSTNEYKEYLMYEGFSESLLEMTRTLRAKGKGDDSEKMLTK
jgi:hypothetical protein